MWNNFSENILKKWIKINALENCFMVFGVWNLIFIKSNNGNNFTRQFKNNKNSLKLDSIH